MTAVRVPWASLRLHEDAAAVNAAIRRVLDRGWFVLGPEVEAFEHEYAAACRVAHAVGVGSGTDAITLTLKALGIGPGDEVITTPLSAAYTALGVMMAGARPVFADIDAERLTLDPAAVRAAVGPRTAALLPVHLYGQPADMPALVDVASRMTWLSWRIAARPTWPPAPVGRSERSVPQEPIASIRPRTSVRSVTAVRFARTKQRWPTACGAYATAGRAVATTTVSRQATHALTRFKRPCCARGCPSYRGGRSVGARWDERIEAAWRAGRCTCRRHWTLGMSTICFRFGPDRATVFVSILRPTASRR